MDLGLQGHSALVTAASRGIGAAVARRLSAELVDPAFPSDAGLFCQLVQHQKPGVVPSRLVLRSGVAQSN